MRQNGFMGSFRDRLLARWDGLRRPMPGEVQVFGLRTGADPDLEALAWPMLTETEQQRAGRFLLAVARDEFVLGRAALRCLISAALGVGPEAIALRVDAYGKPSVEGLHSNVSHSRGLIYVALTADAPVGVDVEWVDPALEALELAEANFQPDEAKGVAVLPEGIARARLFCELWTRKEAVAKAHGHGLRIPLRRIAVPRAVTGQARIELEAMGESQPPEQKIGFYVESLSAPEGFALAMAVQGDTAPRVSRWDFHE